MRVWSLKVCFAQVDDSKPTSSEVVYVLIPKLVRIPSNTKRYLLPISHMLRNQTPQSTEKLVKDAPPEAKAALVCGHMGVMVQRDSVVPTPPSARKGSKGFHYRDVRQG